MREEGGNFEISGRFGRYFWRVKGLFGQSANSTDEFSILVERSSENSEGNCFNWQLLSFAN